MMTNEVVNKAIEMKQEARNHVTKIIDRNDQVAHMLATSNEDVKAMQMASTLGSGFGSTNNFGVHTIITLTNERILLSYFDMVGNYIETISYLYEEVGGITTYNRGKLECLYINTTHNKHYTLFASNAHYNELFTYYAQSQLHLH